MSQGENTPVERQPDRSELPLLTHTEVLGVDIAYHQREEGDVEFRVYGRDHTSNPKVKRELSYWARRNLFGGHNQ